MLLSAVSSGNNVKIEAIHIKNPALTSRLATLGILPGTEVRMVNNSGAGTYILGIYGSRLVLGKEIVQDIQVL